MPTNTGDRREHSTQSTLRTMMGGEKQLCRQISASSRISNEISIIRLTVLSPEFTGLETNPDRNNLSFTETAVERYKRGGRAGAFRLRYLGFVAPHLISKSSICKTFTHLKFQPTNVRVSPWGLDAAGTYFPASSVPSHIAYAFVARPSRRVAHRSDIHHHLVMTSDQVRDYLEKQLFIENTVVR